MNNLAADVLWQGKYAQAEALHSQTLEIRAACWVPSIPTRWNP
jgi:hypothetical protein